MSNFTNNIYMNIHKMKKHGWTYDEIMLMSPIELNIFKSLILLDQNK